MTERTSHEEVSAGLKLMEHIAESVDTLGRRFDSLADKVGDTRDRVIRLETVRNSSQRDIERLFKCQETHEADFLAREAKLKARLHQLESLREQARGAVSLAGWVRQNVAWLVAAAAFAFTGWTNFGQ
jgi:hypothetical protein